MEFSELKKSLSTCIYPVYLIRGKDAFLRQKSLHMIENTCVKYFPDFNIVRFSDENYNITNIITACKAIPMGDKYRVVVLKDLAFRRADEAKILLEYVKKPVDTTCLVIVDSVSSNVYKDMIKYAQNVNCDFLDESTLQRIILSQLKENEAKITAEAINKLMHFCNFDLTRITGEVTKLANFAGTGNVISGDMVELLVHKDVEYNVFELNKAASSRDSAQAMRVLKQMLERKESPQMLMMTILASFRRMFYTVSSGLSDAEIGEKLGVKPYSIKVARQLAVNFAPVRLKKILELGAELDLQIRAGKITEQNALIYFVSSIVM